MKAEGGAANGGVHANYVAGLVDLGASRDGMGWDGWMDGSPTRAPANSFYNPNFASAAGEDFVGVSPILASSLQGAPQASGRQGEGKEQHLLRGGLGHIKFLFVRLVPVGKHPALWWQVRSCWSVVAFSTSLELW